jgi:transcription elongation factor Elf1
VIVCPVCGHRCEYDDAAISFRVRDAAGGWHTRTIRPQPGVIVCGHCGHEFEEKANKTGG